MIPFSFLLVLLSIGGEPKIAYKQVARRTQFPRRGLLAKRTFDAGKEPVFGVLPNLTLELSPMTVKGKHSSVMTFMKIEAPCKFTIIDDKEANALLDQIESHVIFHRGKKNKHTKKNKNKNKNGKKDIDENKFDDSGSRVHIVFSSVSDKKDNGDEKNGSSGSTAGLDFLTKIDSDSGSRHGIGAFYQLIRKGLCHGFSIFTIVLFCFFLVFTYMCLFSVVWFFF